MHGGGAGDINVMVGEDCLLQWGLGCCVCLDRIDCLSFGRAIYVQGAHPFILKRDWKAKEPWNCLEICTPGRFGI